MFKNVHSSDSSKVIREISEVHPSSSQKYLFYEVTLLFVVNDRVNFVEKILVPLVAAKGAVQFVASDYERHKLIVKVLYQEFTRDVLLEYFYGVSITHRLSKEKIL